MTEQDITTMTPEAVRRELAERLGYTVRRDPTNQNAWEFLLNGEYAGMTMHYPPSFPVETIEDAWREAWKPDLECGDTILPNWPADPGAALSLAEQVLYNDGLDIEFFKMTDGRVMAFDGRARVLSSLAHMDTYRAYSWPSLTDFAMKCADALSRVILAELWRSDERAQQAVNDD